MSRNLHRVRLGGEKLDHVVHASVDVANRQSLCGRSAWPGSWDAVTSEKRPMCADCASKIRGKR